MRIRLTHIDVELDAPGQISQVVQSLMHSLLGSRPPLPTLPATPAPELPPPPAPTLDNSPPAVEAAQPTPDQSPRRSASPARRGRAKDSGTDSGTGVSPVVPRRKPGRQPTKRKLHCLDDDRIYSIEEAGKLLHCQPNSIPAMLRIATKKGQAEAKIRGRRFRWASEVDPGNGNSGNSTGQDLHEAKPRHSLAATQPLNPYRH
jgi:hypothetical protein